MIWKKESKVSQEETKEKWKEERAKEVIEEEQLEKEIITICKESGEVSYKGKLYGQEKKYKNYIQDSWTKECNGSDNEQSARSTTKRKRPTTMNSQDGETKVKATTVCSDPLTKRVEETGA